MTGGGIEAIGAGAATAAVLAGAWARSQWCTSQLLGGTLVHGPEPRELALTFDDGPNDRYTQEVLEKLNGAGVRATFFFIGSHARQLPWLVRAVSAAGHVVGNHTMTHARLAYRSGGAIRREIAECSTILEDTLGMPVRYFRPPHGSRRPAVLRIAQELGLQTVMWNSMGFDWRRNRTAKMIMKSVERSIRSNRKAGKGTTILLHDGGPSDAMVHRGTTVAALTSLLERGRAANYRFVTVDDWWGGDRPEPLASSA